MELNLVINSAGIIAKRLTNGLQVFIYGTTPEMANLPFYRRFIKTPAMLSLGIACLWLSIYFAALSYCLSGYWGGLLTLPLMVLGTCCALILRSMIKVKMMRARMWKWGKDKFNSWDAFSEWMALTPFYKLNEIAELDDTSWQPNKGGGVSIF